ncbi:MAG TPA: hypothetical protein VEJ63_01155, partial [Planctomycetota bacterium]|nr:hypothetical protein [Planctomycetota bacterium]
MRWLVTGFVLLCFFQQRIDAAEERSPIGPVILELSDKSTVSGLLLDINDDMLLVRTRDGEKTFERKKVRKLDTVSGKEAAGLLNIIESKPKPAASAPAPATTAKPAPAPAGPAPAPAVAAPAPVAAKDEALTIGKATKPDTLIVDDIDDEEVPLPKKKPRVAENADKQLLAR